MADSSAPTSTRRARGIDRLIALCQELHFNRAPMSARELMEATGAPRSSIYDLIGLLTEAGWLETDSDGRIFFGRAMHYYGLDYADHNDLIKRARPIMRRLAAEFGETTQLCSLDGDKYTVMLNEHGARPFTISSEIGIKVPVPWTASGRILLGDMSRETILGLIPDADFILPSGQPIDIDDFLSEIQIARRNGYALTDGLVDSFVCCMAAPIHEADGQVRATLCFTISRDTPDARRQDLIDALLAASRTLSSR